MVAALVVIVLALGVGLFLTMRDASRLERASRPETTTTTEAAAASGTVPKDFTTHRDPQAGFSISYPKVWQQLGAPDGDLRLLLGAGGQDSLLVRVVTLEQPVTAENLADVKAFTDSIVMGSGVEILQQRSITLNDLPGYYYLYAFVDAESGQQGVHAHYFLFSGTKMNTLVFQALPADNFTRLAPVFDAVAESFKATS